jgi:hypothetical protein
MNECYQMRHTIVGINFVDTTLYVRPLLFFCRRLGAVVKRANVVLLLQIDWMFLSLPLGGTGPMHGIDEFMPGHEW